ncbi:MAG: hypothetical protein IMZ50_08025 [Candidatus Atribacteria bacterium]|nr:hypothetical protein [Candidatus Atribacteria bacterium]
MNSASPFVTIEKPGEETIYWTIRQLENAGLQVIRTFDLREARHSHPDCPCPHHGTEACNCQMSVLLIYQEEQSPASILIHSFLDTTWLYLVDTPEQPVDQNLDLLIREILTLPVPGSIENRE